MGTEIITDMSSGSGWGAGHYTEFDLSLVLPGDSESLRPRLADALERLGYRVINEQPLQARRSARGWGSSMMSSDVLDYPVKLSVAMKASGEWATLVTFDYVIGHPMLTKGDRQTIAREAEAIAALATQRATAVTCQQCGTEGTSDSRFCRRCGIPLIANSPAEIEVLRLTAGSRAGYQTVVTSAIFLAILNLAVILAPFISNPKGALAMAIIGWIFGGLGWLMMLFGLRRLHRTLNPKERREALPPVEPRRVIAPSHTMPLPPEQAPMSVTESTTELLPPVHAEVRDRNTG